MDERKDLRKDNWIKDWGRAIILAQVSKIAQKADHYARATKKQLDGSQLFKYIREKFGISLSESMFKTIRRVLCGILEVYSMNDDDNLSV